MEVGRSWVVLVQQNTPENYSLTIPDSSYKSPIETEAMAQAQFCPYGLVQRHQKQPREVALTLPY